VRAEGWVGVLNYLLDLVEAEYPRIAQAMRRVPRDQFVPPAVRDLAWEDEALPIGCGQTISQPSLVAYMTRQLDLRPGDKVLEIGTGSGYQCAVLAALGDVEVYSVEIIPELAEQAAARLRALRFINVHLKRGDGSAGWPECAPYNAIIITAAAERVPPPLFEQLADGGRLLVPIGPPHGCQVLCKYVKQAGRLSADELLLVAFVPLTHERPAAARAKSP
jgi:protein-L-isoaspartate(D-aspartate) O-methyltransferase